jgi:putative ABC transport system permease protein
VTRRLTHLFEYLFRRRRLEDDLDEELRSSFEMIVDRFVARGMTQAEARRAARIEFEGLEQVKEKVRDGLAGSAVQTFLQDVRYAWRGLRRRPSFAFIAVVTLALGIGVNTAIFSVFYGVLLHPLPYRQPARLVRIWASYRDAGYARAPFSGPMLGEIERRNRSLADVAAIWVVEPRTFTGAEPEQAKCARVTTNFFDVLGVRAAQGRTFIKQDTGTPAVILTDGIFRRRFLANQALLGKGLPTRDAAATLAGVLPAEFQLQFAPDANVPADVQIFDLFGPNLRNMNGRFLRLVARLKPGVTLADAQRDLERVAAEMRAAFTNMAANQMQLKVAGLQADAFGDIQPALAALFAGAAFVLSICCVNVTSLLLARAGERRKEIALRLTLGASRGRILRQLLAEGFVLCFLGGVCGITVGWAGFRGLLAIRPERLARIADAGLSWPVLAFAAAASLAAALVFGFVPAIESFRLDLIATLRAGGRGWLGRVQRRAGGALVVGEIALGFVLVTGAALTARTLSKLERVRPGFEPRQLLTFQLPVGYSPAERRAVVEWEAELAALPGVERVGAISHLPLDHDLPNWYGPYRPQGTPPQQPVTTAADYRSITPGYFAAMDARLIEGRYFDQLDRDGGRPVLIIDEIVSRSTWPGEPAIGRKIDIQGESRTVVGVVEHVRNHSLTEDVRGIVYMPVDQSPRSPLTFVLRTPLEPLSLVPAIRANLRGHNPNAALGKIRPMTGYVDRALAPAGFTAVLATVFGILALLLAGTGIYGVLNYQVSRRLPEMGIRMALGARARDVLRLVLGEGLMLSAAGVLLGAAGSLVASRWLGALVYGVGPRDPLSYVLALLLLPAAALLGCWRPAWRAAASNPAETIREE